MKLVIIPSTMHLHLSCYKQDVNVEKLTETLISNELLISGDLLVREIEGLLEQRLINSQYIKQISVLLTPDSLELTDTDNGCTVHVSALIQVGIPVEINLQEGYLVDMFTSQPEPVFANVSAVIESVKSRMTGQEFAGEIIGVDLSGNESLSSNYYSSSLRGVLIDVPINEFDENGDVIGHRTVQLKAQDVSQLLSDSSVMMQYMAKAHMTNDAGMQATRSLKTGLVEKGLLSSY